MRIIDVSLTPGKEINDHNIHKCNLFQTADSALCPLLSADTLSSLSILRAFKSLKTLAFGGRVDRRRRTRNDLFELVQGAVPQLVATAVRSVSTAAAATQRGPRGSSPLSSASALFQL